VIEARRAGRRGAPGRRWGALGRVFEADRELPRGGAATVSTTRRRPSWATSGAGANLTDPDAILTGAGATRPAAWTSWPSSPWPWPSCRRRRAGRRLTDAGGTRDRRRRVSRCPAIAPAAPPPRSSLSRQPSLAPSGSPASRCSPSARPSGARPGPLAAPAWRATGRRPPARLRRPPSIISDRPSNGSLGHLDRLLAIQVHVTPLSLPCGRATCAPLAPL